MELSTLFILSKHYFRVVRAQQCPSRVLTPLKSKLIMGNILGDLFNPTRSRLILLLYNAGKPRIVRELDFINIFNC